MINFLNNYDIILFFVSNFYAIILITIHNSYNKTIKCIYIYVPK